MGREEGGHCRMYWAIIIDAFVYPGGFVFEYSEDGKVLFDGRGVRRSISLVMTLSSTASCGCKREVERWKCVVLCGFVDADRPMFGTPQPVLVGKQQHDYYNTVITTWHFFYLSQAEKTGQC